MGGGGRFFPTRFDKCLPRIFGMVGGGWVGVGKSGARGQAAAHMKEIETEYAIV